MRCMVNDQLIRSDRYNFLCAALTICEPFEKEIINLRYGLNGGQEKTIDEVGAIMHMPANRVLEVFNRVLSYMRVIDKNRNRV